MFPFKLRKIFVATIVLLIDFINVQSQTPIDSIELDQISLKAKKGFTVDDFIRMTKTDTSFYKAFKNLKMYGHQSINKVNVNDKRGNPKASMYREAKHFSNQKKGWITITKESTNGKYYKRKGGHKYFTAEMYDKVFFKKDTFSVSNKVSEKYAQKEMKNLSKEEKYMEQLKTFMFSPGTGVEGVPIIGKKLNIFEGKMMQYYDYSIDKKQFHDSIPCYVFKCKLKDGIKPEKVVIKNLTTYYDRRTMNIIARTYQIKQKTVLFDFDIKMYIELILDKNEYLPVIIRYNGAWDVPMAKPERIDFQMFNSNFKVR